MPPQPITRNTLFYGDNLNILREYIPTASVDLIYLDPPFNSSRSYNVLFKDESGLDSEAQITAFEDTWHWSGTAEDTWRALVSSADVPQAVATAMDALIRLIGRNQMMAYLVMMTARLVELHRVLKPTGSLYLHCDPTASHYLKVILDAIFDSRNFVNEIDWKRTTTKNDARQGAKNWPRIHDVILYYAKSYERLAVFEQPFAPHSDGYIASHYSLRDEDGRAYQLDNLTAPGSGSRGHPQYEFLGVTRYWRYNREKMERLLTEGRVVQPRPGAVPRYKRYLDEMAGIAIGDFWDDIPALNSQAKERLGYPTQKPVALLERIIAASSNPGDIVLDPFCGCGTAIAAAEKLGRRWIGIDITHLSIALQKYRLEDAFDLKPKTDYDVIGEPVSVQGAMQLARDNRHQFEWWALSLVQARPVGGEAGSKRGKKGADRGIDGVITFIDEANANPKRILVQVKSGHVGAGIVRDLVGTVEREKAAMGVLLTLEAPTRPMINEALSAGTYRSPLNGREYPRIQILSIEDLLAGQVGVKMPMDRTTFKQAERSGPSDSDQPRLFE